MNIVKQTENKILICKGIKPVEKNGALNNKADTLKDTKKNEKILI